MIQTHIAGKLGVKTFLLLPFNDDKLWYWGLNTDNNIIWYPQLNLSGWKMIMIGVVVYLI